MAATAVTIANLFGSESKVTLIGQSSLVEFQEDAFSGLQDSVFVTSLGGRGYLAEFAGLLRSSAQSTRALAASALQTVVNTIRGYQKAGTLLDLFSGDTSNTAILYSQGIVWRGLVVGFEEGTRSFSAESGNFRALCDFRLTYRVLQKV